MLGGLIKFTMPPLIPPKQNLAQRGEGYRIHVFVHCFSGECDLANCGARIKVPITPYLQINR